MSVERLQKLLTVLPSSGLDRDLIAWLLDGFEAFEHRGDDLEAALNVASGESMSMDERDGLLRVVLDLSPGDSFAARCCYTIDCLDGATEHRDELAAMLILRLRRSRIRLPNDRQLRRINNGHRCEDSYR